MKCTQTMISVNKRLILTILFVACLLGFTELRAQEYSIEWSGTQTGEINFKNATFSSSFAYLPVFSQQIKGRWNAGSVEVLSSIKIPLSSLSPAQVEQLTETWQFRAQQGTQKRETITTVELLPVRKAGNEAELATTFRFNVQADNRREAQLRAGMQYASNSVLASGEWFKIGVSQTGVYKLDVNFLEQLGINFSNVRAGEIKIYGHKGGMLPEQAGGERTDDLREIPIKVIAQGNKFEIHAYLEGPESWYYDATRSMFRQTRHLYSDYKAYFITYGNGNGKRVPDAPDVPGTATKNINVFDDYQHVEEDLVNLKESGRLWLGPEFGANNTFSYNFTFNNIISGQPAKVWLGVAARSELNTSSFEVRSGNTTLRSFNIGSVGTSYLGDAAKYTETTATISGPGTTIPVSINYGRPDFNSKAWIDFITINVQRNLVYNGEPLSFRSLSSVGTGSVSQFNISNWTGTELWDVTDIFNIQRINAVNGSFKAATETLKEFIGFNTPTLTPTALGKVSNQNLHALPQADYLIVTRKSMLSYARELGEFHLEKEGYSYHVVDAEEIFNEFSSGNNDLSAIRNFVKMFYDRAEAQPGTEPKFLLLFGNGNYNNKNLGDYLLPAYQSPQSLQTIDTYVTDDYFGLLDDTEGADVINTATNLLDIAIGRIVADNTEKAAIAVEKVKRYYEAGSLGDWREQIAFVADDEDNNIHIRDANEVADIIQNNYLNYNVSKIYLDAFKQQSVAGGQRYPDVNEAIANKIFTGLFYLNFVGHGGPNGLTDEKILTFDDINRWTNPDKLFLFCTATCEFTRFDEPNRYSAGERILLKKNGGAIALVSTTRLVFSDKNRIINENFTKQLFQVSRTGNQSIGEIFMVSKVITNTRENNRKFALFGDPAITMAFPKYDIVTTEVAANKEISDTLKALSRVTLKGEVRENDQRLENFNGIVNVTVFDKIVIQSTMENDAASPAYNFKVRNSALYRGRAEVKNGAFSITFIVPKDINYTFGQGKLSYYAENGQTDAGGYDTTVIIGGVADSIPKDNEGPIVDIYIDDESFVYGGTASPNSTLYIKLKDESGINTSGTGLGHDITAILNDDNKNPIILNTFYEGDIGDFTQGKVAYPFNKLENGRYTLRAKAWDVLNNSGDGYTEFIVEDNASLALYYVLNYPNPFTTKTHFSFEHNRPGESLDIRIEIFTVSGKLVKTLQTYKQSNARRISDIEWDGLDEFGDRIGRGVYIYRISVKDASGEKAYKYQKLVLLR